MRAIWRDRRERLVTWLWPEHTRVVSKPFAVVVLVLNIAPLPGLGTALYGRWERGALQLVLTFLFLIGWVWAIADGLRIVHRAFTGPDPRRAPRTTGSR